MVMLPPAPDRRDLYKQAYEHGVMIDKEDDHGSWFGSPFLMMMLVTLGFILLIFMFLPRLRDPMGGVPPAFGRSGSAPC